MAAATRGGISASEYFLDGIGYDACGALHVLAVRIGRNQEPPLRAEVVALQNQIDSMLPAHPCADSQKAHLKSVIFSMIACAISGWAARSMRKFSVPLTTRAIQRCRRWLLFEKRPHWTVLGR